MGSLLLEVLLQIGVLETTPSGFRTRSMRVDELLMFLRERYGICVDVLPRGDGFTETSITERAALRENLDSFKRRLRELGFFRDLSDAYVAQTVEPRYAIAAGSGTKVSSS
jgi:hypothetical protein